MVAFSDATGLRDATGEVGATREMVCRQIALVLFSGLNTPNRDAPKLKVEGENQLCQHPFTDDPVRIRVLPTIPPQSRFGPERDMVRLA